MSEASTPRGYVPRTTGNDREFFRATLFGGLHLQTCQDCGHRQHPPRYLCAACHSKALDFQPASGKGRVLTFTVTHATRDRGWTDHVPYGTALVETDEGPRIVTAWRGTREELRPGVRVRVDIDPINEEFGLLWAAPDRD